MKLSVKGIRSTIFLLILGFLAAGCATVELPLVRDDIYPSKWPAITTAGVQCQDISGTYLNEGTVVDEKGNQAPVFLSNLLEKWDSGREDLWARTEKVSLNVKTKKLDKNGDSFASLQVALAGDSRDPAFNRYAADFTARNRLDECCCVKNTLAVGQRRHRSYGFPYIGAGGGDTALWLTQASDGSLIARIKDAENWIGFPAPHGKESLFWAIFRPVEEL